jgi:hypothetical protein
MKNIQIDLNKTESKNSKNYNPCVGGGRAYETLLAENQRHLKIVHDNSVSVICGSMACVKRHCPVGFITTHV